MANVVFRCPICRNQRVATREIIGRRVRCAACENFVSVTTADIEIVSDEDRGQVTMSESRWKDDQSSARDSGGSGERPEPTASFESSVTASSQASKPIGRWKETADDADVSSSAAEEEVRFGGKGDREPMEMDMTPMVDVTFLLLIFFMVTASFTLLKTIKQPPPSSEEPSTQVTELEDNPDYVLVFIDEFNTYTVVYGPIEAEAPSEQELYVRLREAMASSPALPPTKLLVKAHGDATHERVVTAMDAGTEVGLSQVQVMLTEQESL